MKKLIYIVALLIWLLPVRVEGAVSTDLLGAKLDDRLLEAVLSAPADTVYDILLSTGSNRSSVRKLATTAGDLENRYTKVGSFLRKTAEKGQEALVATLNQLGSSAKSRLVSRFWIANLVRIQTDREGLLTLAARDDVVRVYPNAVVELIEPFVAGDDATAVRPAQANLDAIGAGTAWAQGFTGKGRLIASIDTGVEGIHPALQGSWRGRLGDTAAAWFDPFGNPAPIDQSGHGTHVMGIMVGRNGSDTIGVAPDADWICAAVIDRGSSLATTIADILDALQWVADPDGNPETTGDVPDVVCNSWGISQQIVNPCDSVFFEAIDNVEAMGIVCVFAAGNEGPNSMTIRNPADHAGSPTNTFSVGAVDATVQGMPTPSFSSRGPSACDGYSIKPEIAAPGVAIYSAWKGRSYRAMNGTSMAAPFVAGAVAILRQFNPDLTPEEIKQVLLETAVDIGDAGEDNESGHGLLDLAAALAAVAPPLRPQVEVAGFVGDAVGDAILNPGETAPFTVTLTGSASDAHDLVAELAPLTAGVTVPANTAYFGTLLAGETADNSDAPFVVSVPASAAVGNLLLFQLTLSGDPLMDLQTDTLSLVCGLPAGGEVGTLDNGALALSLTNFGRLGVGPNSQMDAGGHGWSKVTDGLNILYEASLLIASASGALLDASRGSMLDFSPVEPITTGLDPEGFYSGTTVFDDARAQSPLGVEVIQRVIMYPDLESVVFVEWRLRNSSSFTIEGVQCGLLIDVDLPVADVGSERIVPAPEFGGFYYDPEIGSRFAGAVPLDGEFAAMRFLMNDDGKLALDAAQKREALEPGTDELATYWGDAFAVVATAPHTLEPDQALTFTVALLMADSRESLLAAAADARNRWFEYTGVLEDEDTQVAVPRAHLSQNFPNPFNPETQIAYALAREGHVRLEVFNLLGQSVNVLVDGWNQAGRRSVIWDGTDGRGQRVASGIYFYRLLTDKEIVSKKMVLLR